MKPKMIFLFVLFLSLFPLNSFANDTDIYAARGQGVQPNILIMFDNSQSMSDSVPCQPNPTRVYSKTTYFGGYYWQEYATSIDDAITQIGGTPCPIVRTHLLSPGYHSGNTRQNSSGTCNKNSMTLATGAWINTNDPQHDDLDCAKIDVGKQVMTDFVTKIQNVRVGLMIFNSQGCEKHADGTPICNKHNGVERRNTHGGCTDGCDNTGEYEGGHIVSIIDSIDNNRAALTSGINSLTAETYTPLAETLFEAGLYFKGSNTIFNMDTSGTYPNNFPKYVSPIQYSCQKNYIIIITDGASTMDHNAVLNTLAHSGDYDNKGEDPYGPSPCSSHNPCYSSGGTDYLNDVAKYLYDTQGISVYTIGFAVDLDLLKRTAQEANGHYYTASDAQQLQGAFASVIDEILSKSTSFVAPIVPVSRLERTSAGDKIYLALFKPKQTKMWSGNIKKYGVAQSDDLNNTYKQGDVLDSSNSKAIDDTTGEFYPASISYWNADQDGDEVEKGGAGEILQKRDLDTRNIYTFFKASAKVNLYDAANAFTTTNASITTSVLNLVSGSKDDLINYIYGYDAYQDESTDVNKTRSWILGSCLHSRPCFINYASQSVIFAGSNDGMLHAFNDADGAELWAFIPPDLLPNLQYVHSDSNLSFIDGSPKAYVTYVYNTDGSIQSVTQAILIFGERRGGNRYYALDVTTPSQPKFLWYITPTERVYQTTTYTTDYEELGQSWSAPTIGKIACSGGSHCVNGERWVAFIGGGYDDTNQDKQNPYTSVPDTKGRAVYVVDIFDGSLVKRFSNAENASMTYSIPSDIVKVDVGGDGKVDRLYVGDMAGRMWRFDVHDASPSNWTGKIVFKSNPDGATTNLRKIFYPPDVTLEGGYEMLFFGTGDREHPNDKTIVNRLYGVKDRSLATAYGDGDLVDVTDDLIQTGTATEKQDTLTQLNSSTSGGWLIKLLPTTSGEKCLASAVVFYGVAYFTTFAPSADAPPPGQDPCYVGEGTANLYALGYKTGAAQFNLDLTNDTSGGGGGSDTIAVYTKNDRSQTIGTAIPSGVIITIIQDRAVAYVGMGGGVIGSNIVNNNNDNNNNNDDCPNCKKIPLKKGKPLAPVNWRIVF